MNLLHLQRSYGSKTPALDKGLIHYLQILISFLIVLKWLLPYQAALTLGF